MAPSNTPRYHGQLESNRTAMEKMAGAKNLPALHTATSEDQKTPVSTRPSQDLNAYQSHQKRRKIINIFL